MDNPIKFSIQAIDYLHKERLHQKSWRGDETKIDIYALDGLGLKEMIFNGVVRTREDAIRLSEFFKVHAYCFPKEDGNF